MKMMSIVPRFLLVLGTLSIFPSLLAAQAPAGSAPAPKSGQGQEHGFTDGGL